MPYIAGREVSAVIFDCDGVLVNSEELAIKGERRALSEFGLDYTPEDFVRRFIGLHDDAYFCMLAEDFTSKFAAPPPDDFDARVLAGRRSEMGALAPIDGALTALSNAKRLIGAIAIASSSRAHFLEAKLKRTGLWDHAAPHVYSADLVKEGKPAPDVFLYAAERLGVGAARCLVIEDSENGVRAGVAAGMTVCGFTGGGHCFDGHGDRLTAAGASWIAPNFEALVAAIGARQSA